MADNTTLTINGLTISEDNEQWSVIAPDGRVVGIFPDKADAVYFADHMDRYSQPKDIFDDETLSDLVIDEESAFDLPIPAATHVEKEKRKAKSRWHTVKVPDINPAKQFFINHRKQVENVALTLVALAGFVLIVFVVVGVAPAVWEFLDRLVNSTLFKIAVVGPIVIVTVWLLWETMQYGDMYDWFYIALFGCIVLGVAAILDAIGLLPILHRWLFGS